MHCQQHSGSHAHRVCSCYAACANWLLGCGPSSQGFKAHCLTAAACPPCPAAAHASAVLRSLALQCTPSQRELSIRLQVGGGQGQVLEPAAARQTSPAVGQAVPLAKHCWLAIAAASSLQFIS